jgi:hypothetical protein
MKIWFDSERTLWNLAIWLQCAEDRVIAAESQADPKHIFGVKKCISKHAFGSETSSIPSDHMSEWHGVDSIRSMRACPRGVEVV